jgi:hypothetical protein
MQACMYVCMYVRTNVCMYVCMYVCIASSVIIISILQNVWIHFSHPPWGFWVAFAKLRKATITFITSLRPYVCLSVCLSLSSCNNSATNGRSFIKLETWAFFESLSRKSKFDENLTRITGNLDEDVRTFPIISRWILLRTRNVSH